jgi:rhodanese-related sulfurtransferase
MISTITAQELRNKQLSDERFVLAEALDEPYFAKGHLPGAVNMPLGRVAEVAAQEAPDTSMPIVVYCASATCKNSDIAARKLETLGYANVRVFSGGKAEWKDAGLPLDVTP